MRRHYILRKIDAWSFVLIGRADCVSEKFRFNSGGCHRKR
jgi:hypothetical protein